MLLLMHEKNVNENGSGNEEECELEQSRFLANLLRARNEFSCYYELVRLYDFNPFTRVGLLRKMSF